MLATFKPDMLTLDLRMPGIDGLDLLRFLQKTKLGGTQDTNGVRRHRDTPAGRANVGGARYLRKPFSNDELIAVIEAMLERSGNGIVSPNTRGPLKSGRTPTRQGAALRSLKISNAPAK